MNTKIYLLVLAILISGQIFGQEQGVSITTDNTPPDPSAMLDVKHTGKGILIPRMTTTQRNAITNPANSLMVYDTDFNAYFYYKETVWTQIGEGIVDLWTQNESNIYYTTGNVGIGTTTPTDKLEIAGNLKIKGGYIQFVEGAQYFKCHENFILDLDNNFNTNDAYFEVRTDESTSLLKVMDNGNVGIGTTTPAGDLEVFSAGYQNQAIDQSQANINVSGGGTSQWQSFTAGVSGQLSQIDLYVSSPLSASNSPGTIKIYEGEGTGGTLLTEESVVFEQVSNFQQFDLSMPVLVASGSKYTIQFSVPYIEKGWVSYTNYDSYAGGRANYASDEDLAFKTHVRSIGSKQSTMLISTGNVGIGTTTPARKLHVSEAMRLEPQTSPPDNPAKGDLYFDDNDNILKCYDGTQWQNCW